MIIGYNDGEKMRLMWVGLCGLFLMVILSNCTNLNVNMPDDFALVFFWDTGALPPQYRYEYVITIGPGSQGEFEYVPGYGDENNPEFWVTPLELSDEKLKLLFDYFNRNEFFTNKWNIGESSVGGSNTSLVITAFGKDHHVPSISSLKGDDLEAVKDAQDFIRSFVPQSIWDEMEARQTAFEKTYSD